MNGYRRLQEEITTEKLVVLYDENGGYTREADKAVAELINNNFAFNGIKERITNWSVYRYRLSLDMKKCSRLRRKKTEVAVEAPVPPEPKGPVIGPEEKVPEQTSLPLEAPEEACVELGDEVCVWMNGKVIVAGKITFVPTCSIELWHIRSNKTGLLVGISPQSSHFESMVQV